MSTKANPLNVFLSTDIDSPQAEIFKRFCGVFEGRLLFLNCSAAVIEGEFLRVDVQPERPGDESRSYRIHHRQVLVTLDGPVSRKQIGFHYAQNLPAEPPKA
jgi:hypothetical protein